MSNEAIFDRGQFPSLVSDFDSWRRKLLEPKKPGTGARDLADLKAKLGLLKPTPVGGAPIGKSGTMEGAVPQAPAAAVDTKRNPFAQVQARPVVAADLAPIVDAGPQVVVPATPKSKGPMFLLGGAAVVLAVLGFWWGLVYRARLLHNITIEEAAIIRDEVVAIRKKSQPIYNAIVGSVNRRKGDVDLQFVDELAKLGSQVAPKTEKLFRTNYVELPNLTIDRLFNYYNDTIRLYEEANRFVRDWNKDEARKEIEKAIQKSAGTQTTYGVVIDGSGDIPLGMLVEVGTPVCQDPAQKDCSARQIVSFNVRTDIAGRWAPRKVRGVDAERVIPVKPDTALAEKVLAGGTEMLAARQFRIQFAQLFDLSRKLTAIEKDVVDDLAKAAAQRKVFTF